MTRIQWRAGSHFRGWCVGVGILVGLTQVPADAGAQLRFLSRAGLYASGVGPGRAATSAGEWEVGRRNPSFAWGGALELGPPDLTTFRLNVLHGTEGSAPVRGTGCESRGCRARTSLLALTGTVIVRPVPWLSLVQPYLLVGGGLKRYSVRARSGERDAAFQGVLEGGPALTAQMGVGVEWTLGLFRGVVEISDLPGGGWIEGTEHVSGGEGSFQHDLFLTLGITLG